MNSLPIHEIEQDLLTALEDRGAAMVTAPTGAGKTTLVPRILSHSGLIEGQIIVLQPRRLATRLVAARVAREEASPLGGLVGYQTRHHSRISSKTRIRFMTEGLFLRLLLADPLLKGIGTVVLDEFHERHLEGDLALSLCRTLKEEHRPELKILVMSATLESEAVCAFLDCPVLVSGHRLHEVEISYLPAMTEYSGRVRKTARDEARPWSLAARAISRILRSNESGDLLVFMPGVHEIRQTIEACKTLKSAAPFTLLPLHGDLPAEEQDRAVGPCPVRKVIVTTNVAETSITIEGIVQVIDSGLARIQHFDPRRGLNVLALKKISQSSADQRAGRAGRTQRGSCLRLWPEYEHQGRPLHEAPEIKRLDLAQAALFLKSMSFQDLGAFPWFERPEASALERALSLLSNLGALDRNDRLTDQGREMARLPMHPRLSRMVVEGAARGCVEAACLRAALLSERDFLRKDDKKCFADKVKKAFSSDFELREEALSFAQSVRFDRRACEQAGLQSSACRQVERTFKLFLGIVKRVGRAENILLQTALAGQAKNGVLLAASAGLPDLCVLVAFPDQVARSRGGDSPVYDLPGARSGQLVNTSVMKGCSLLVAAEVSEIGKSGGRVTRLSLAVPIEGAWLEALFPDKLSRQREMLWNGEMRAVEWLERLYYGDLIIKEKAVIPSDTGPAATILAERILAGELTLKHWGTKIVEWLDRVRCTAEWFPECALLTYDDHDLKIIVEEICAGATRHGQVVARPCLELVKNALSWKDQQFVEKMAPERIRLPRGFHMPVKYRPGQLPLGRAKIQDFYDLNETPTVAGGRKKLLLEILGPNFRPVQTTDDLAGFWANLYPKLRKQLSRRYPKHEWR